MIDTPDVSQGTRDEFAISKSKLGWIDRVRMKLALPFLVIGILMQPSEVRKTVASQNFVSDDEVTDGPEP